MLYTETQLMPTRHIRHSLWADRSDANTILSDDVRAALTCSGNSKNLPVKHFSGRDSETVACRSTFV